MKGRLGEEEKGRTGEKEKGKSQKEKVELT